MASRTKRSWSPDSRGYYTRQIGWVQSKAGKRHQHKFLLGKYRDQAEFRERKLRELWDAYAQTRSEDRPLWPEDLLQLAKLIAKGETQLAVERRKGELEASYAERIQRIQAMYPVASYVPADRQAFELGRAKLHSLADIPVDLHLPHLVDGDISIGKNGPRPRIGNLKPATTEQLGSEKTGQVYFELPKFGVVGSIKYSNTGSMSVLQQQQIGIDQANYGPTTRFSNPVDPTLPTQFLHEALTAYQRHIETQFYRDEAGRLTDWGQAQVKQIQLLKNRHPDRPLGEMDSDQVNRMINYWRRRPPKKNTAKPMKAKSAGNYLSMLIRFLKWLDMSSSFRWTKPFAFNDIDTKIQTLADDHVNHKLEQVDTFSLDELKLLMRYGQPLDRLMLLAGLNCGFGGAEIASLNVGESRLFEAHTPRHCEILNYQSTDQDSFIKRVRRKNGVYGEHILFPLTVQGVQWAIEERRKHPEFSKDARLLLNKNGKPLDHPTKSGNANQAIPNRFARLIKRIQNDGGKIQKLSFNKLRKTAAQLIQNASNGEVMGVFLCHGQPVKSDSLNDAYSNRPFGSVFHAIRLVEQQLQEVFAEAGPNPFERQPEAYTKRSTIDRIIQMHKDGYPTGQIAAVVGMAGSTVSRQIQRFHAAN